MTNFASTLGAWTIELLGAFTTRLPASLRDPMMRLIGFIYGRLPHGQRRSLRTNLHTLLDMNEPELTRTIHRVFRNFVFTLYDFFFPKGLIMSVPDRALLETLRKRHGGVLMLTFHMGNWELGARTMAEWGWPVTAVYQPYKNQAFKRMIESRRAPGVNFIPVGGAAAHGVREALQRGDVVAMLGDHPFGEEGIPVELLGHTVKWPKGPVLLAVRERKPIVVAVIVRTGSRQYRALIEPALIPAEKSRGEVARLTQEVAHVFGKVLRQYPEQWYRFREFDYLSKEEAAPSKKRRRAAAPEALPGLERPVLR